MGFSCIGNFIYVFYFVSFLIFPKSKLLSDKAIEVDGSLETGAAGASPVTDVAAESVVAGVPTAAESVATASGL